VGGHRGQKFHGKGIADQRRLAREREAAKQRALSDLDLERKSNPNAGKHQGPVQSYYVHVQREAWRRPPPPPIEPPTPPKLVEISDLPPIQLPQVHELPPPGPGPRVYNLPAGQALAEALNLPQMTALPAKPCRPRYDYCPLCGTPLAGVLEERCPDCGKNLM